MNMESYAYNNYSSNYDDDNSLLSQRDINEIADELSREVTEEINKQFSVMFK